MSGLTGKWLIASNNTHKTADLILALRFYGLEAQPYQSVMDALTFPAESTTSYLANAQQKAEYVAERTTVGVIGDDSGLLLAALGNQALGVTTKRTLRQQGERNDNQALLAALENQTNRQATMVCTLVAVTTAHEIIVASGKVHGYLAQTPTGQFSTGFDRLFQLELGGPTLAEMPDEMRIPLTHRGQAAKRLVAQLKPEDV